MYFLILYDKHFLETVKQSTFSYIAQQKNPFFPSNIIPAWILLSISSAWLQAELTKIDT